MESNQPRVEEIESDNTVERKLQPPNPPKRKKKKVSFAVWLEQQEHKISAETIEQQDASLVTDNESIAKAPETVDQKGDKPTPESESNQKNQVPFKTLSEEHVPTEQEISAGNTEKQNDSLVSEEESTAGVQETIDIAEKEQPSMSKEQPPTTRANKKKMIPFQIWLEKHAPADQMISAESTGTENDSLVTKQESISVLQEIPEKEQPSTSGTENVKKQDTSLPEEEGNQENSLKKICKEEPVVLISATQLVTEKNNISQSQRKVDQKEKKQKSEAKRIKKTPLLWKSFPEPNAFIDLTFFTEDSDINNGPLLENQSYRAALPRSGKKTFWKMLPKSEPRVDVSFIAENIETQNVSMAAQQRDEAASLKKESYSKNLVIPSTQLLINKESIFKPQQTLDQKGEKGPSMGKPKDNIQTENLTEVPDSQTAENVQGESLTEIQNLPNSSEKATSRANCTCLAKFKETELGYIEVQKYLMKQLDEMFDTNNKLNTKLRQQNARIRKLLSERRQGKKSMVSVQIQTDSQDRPEQKTANYQSASIQTEMDVQETSFQLKPVRQTISTQNELSLLLNKQPSETQLNGHQDRQTELLQRSAGKNRTESAVKTASQLETFSNEKVSGANSEKDISTPETVGDPTATIKNEIHTNKTVISKSQDEETVSTTQQHEDQQDERKPSKKYKRKKKRKAAMKAACELETLHNENSELQEVPTLGTVGDQIASIKNDIHMIETEIAKVQQITKEETVSETQQNGNQQDERKPSKKYKRKIRKKAAIKAACELKAVSNENISGENSDQQEVSIPQTVGDPTATIIIEIHRNETVIDKLQQATEEETVSTTQQNGNQQDVRKPSKKYQRKKKRKMAKKAKLETDVNPIETEQNWIQNTKMPKTDLEIIPEIPQTASGQTETKPGKVSEDVTGRVPEGESGLIEEQRTQAKVTLNKGVIKTTPEESETPAAEGSVEQNNVSEQEERPMKKISLWRRLKKALTPTCLRQFKDRSNGHPA